VSGRQFIWASRRETPTYEKLYRVLTNVEWEQKFPLVTMWDMPRTGSGHTPLHIDSGGPPHICNKNNFSFELSLMR
jgi:hypothetical protein